MNAFRHTPTHRLAAMLVVVVGLAWPLAASAQTVEVRIEGYLYAPAELSIKAGTTVKWVNAEKRTSHSILFTGADGFESARIFPGEVWERRFDKPGRYAYICGPHPEMKGLIVVTE